MYRTIMSGGILFHLHKFAWNFSYLTWPPLSELEIGLGSDYSRAQLATFPNVANASGSALCWPFCNLSPPTATNTTTAGIRKRWRRLKDRLLIWGLYVGSLHVLLTYGCLLWNEAEMFNEAAWWWQCHDLGQFSCQVK